MTTLRARDWVTLYSFDDSQPVIRDSFEAFLIARDEQYQKRVNNIGGDRTETLFDVPEEMLVTQEDGTEEVRWCTGPKAKALRAAWRDDNVGPNVVQQPEPEPDGASD